MSFKGVMSETFAIFKSLQKGHFHVIIKKILKTGCELASRISKWWEGLCPRLKSHLKIVFKNSFLFFKKKVFKNNFFKVFLLLKIEKIYLVELLKNSFIKYFKK